MRMVPMGNLLSQLRKQKKWTQSVLGEGLISKTEVSRIENGNKEADVFLLHELVRRMGQSLRYFEIVITGVENELLCLRENIKKSMENVDFERASLLIKEYETVVEREKKIKFHQQYIAEIKSAILEKRQEIRTEVPDFHRIVFLEKEELKKIRKEKGLSQEQVSGNVCARETVSKIENGRTPNHKNLKHLRRRLGGLWYTYYGYVVATEFTTYEMVERYQKLMQENREEANLLLKEICTWLDMSHPVNRQFVEASKLLDKLSAKELSPAEVMAGLEKCLRYTMPEYDGSISRTPHCEETVILNAVVQCLEKVGRLEAAAGLEEELEKC